MAQSHKLVLIRHRCIAALICNPGLFESRSFMNAVSYIPDYLKGKRFVYLFLLALSLYLLSGCAANVTRSLPYTQILPGIIDTAPYMKGSHLGIVPFDSRETEIGGGHHEGLLQVRQPWIFGLSKEQKETLYGNAGELAALSFASELKRQGIRMSPLKDSREPSSNGCKLLLTGKVERVILNTYGHGTKEGYGSAGNYWEATVLFSNIELRDIQSNELLWAGDIKGYAKLENSPARLDWTMLTVAIKSLQAALYLQQMQAAASPLSAMSKGKSYVQTWEADYTIEPYEISPIEVAARHAAAQFLQNISALKNK
jgi:hypothetical protein